jgi:hypothetical protein
MSLHRESEVGGSGLPAKTTGACCQSITALRASFNHVPVQAESDICVLPPVLIAPVIGVGCCLHAGRLSVVPAAAAVPEVYKEGTDPEIQAYQAHQKTAARPTSAEDARTLMKLAK